MAETQKKKPVGVKLGTSVLKPGSQVNVPKGSRWKCLQMVPTGKNVGAKILESWLKG